LYVGDNTGAIYGLAVNPNSGSLSAISPTTQIPVPPVTNNSLVADVGLAADSGGMVLYATVTGTGGPNVFSYLVNKTTGALTAAGKATVSVFPRTLAAIEQNLYVIPDPSQNAAQMFAFSINGSTAALTQLSPTITLPAPANALAIVGFGNNLPSWMGLTFQDAAGGEIQGIARQPNGGATGLQLNPPTSSGGTGAGAIQVTPDGKFVVVVNSGSSNVAVFSLNASTGALTQVSGSPFATGQQPGLMAISPPPLAGSARSGKFVFVADEGGSLSAYTIDSAGSLTAAPGTPVPIGTNAQPVSMAVDTAGKFVYVGLVGRAVAGFSIDQSTGALTPVSGSPFPLNSQGPTRDMVFVP
jgi:6-phosphogluconolactonase (cycloisomerase 2 family)